MKKQANMLESYDNASKCIFWRDCVRRRGFDDVSVVCIFIFWVFPTIIAEFRVLVYTKICFSARFCKTKQKYMYT